MLKFVLLVLLSLTLSKNSLQKNLVEDVLWSMSKPLLYVNATPHTSISKTLTSKCNQHAVTFQQTCLTFAGS